MSVEEDFRKFREYRQQRKEEYLRIKGVLEGVKMMKLSQPTKSIVRLLEFMVDGFHTMENNYGNAVEQQIRINHRVSSLEKKVEELENNILQLRETLDKLFQAK